MTTQTDDPYQSLKDAWQLYLRMDEELAMSHAQSIFDRQPVDDGLDNLSAEIDKVKGDLYALAGPSDTHKERRHNRHSRSEIAGVDETLDETYAALTGLSDAQQTYLTVEKQAKE